MKHQIQALQAEFLKNKYSNILWATFIAFALAPIMGGVFILIINDPDSLAKAGGLAAKAKAMDFQSNWKSYLGLLTQTVGVGGVLVFGFVASWIFGREYSDGTAKDLLSLPTSRTKILNAKFAVYLIWCLALVISNLLIGLLIGTILQLPTIEINLLIPLFFGLFCYHIFDNFNWCSYCFFCNMGQGLSCSVRFCRLNISVCSNYFSDWFRFIFPLVNSRTL